MTVASLSSSGSASTSQSVRREVDYYLNPTELFRWINYRRWDGAKSRAETHPEECGTWIVSRNNDGEINWRHLPLHLMCMQGGNAPAESIHHIEDLVDAILRSYPEGASSADHQGMLPLHMAVSHGATDKMLSSLVTCFPSGAHMKDKFGRTPIDLVNDSPPGPKRDASLRVLRRAKSTMQRMTGSIQKKAAAEVAAVQQSAANERVASQRIIMRLEEELSVAKTDLSKLEHRGESQSQRERDLESELEKMRRQIDTYVRDLDNVTEERDKLNEHMRSIRHKLDNHDIEIAAVEKKASEERDKSNDVIANLKSDVQTAKAMSEAIEDQLRSRFTNEEHLTNNLSELETSLSQARTEVENEKRKYRELKTQLEGENDHLKKTVEDMTNRNMTMQTKIGDLNKQQSGLLASNHSLTSEHERMVESVSRFEHDIMDSVRQERSRVVKSLARQKQLFENAVVEQQRILDEAMKKENEIQATAAEERERAVEVIEKLKAQFKAATVAERERKIQDSARRKQEQQQLIMSNRDSSRSSSTSHNNAATAGKSGGGGSRYTPSRASTQRSVSPTSYNNGKRQTPPSLDNYSLSTPLPYESKRNATVPIYQSASPSTQVTSVAPAGEGHLLRLLENRAESKAVPSSRYGRKVSVSSTFDENSYNTTSPSECLSDSIGYSYGKQRVSVLATREKYASPIEERDGSSLEMSSGSGIY